MGHSLRVGETQTSPIPVKTPKSILCAAGLLTLCAAALHAADAAGKYAPLTYTPLGFYGQALADIEVAKHPELKILTIHVTPRGVPADKNGDRRLMFGNLGRIGKVDNAGDDEAYTNGKEVVEVEKDPAPPSMNFSITATPKYEVLTPLLDKAGNKIGLIVMVFPYHENFDLEIYHKVAQTVASELNGKVGNKDDLLKPAM